MHGFVLVAASKSNHGGVKVSLLVKTMVTVGIQMCCCDGRRNNRLDRKVLPFQLSRRTRFASKVRIVIFLWRRLLDHHLSSLGNLDTRLLSGGQLDVLSSLDIGCVAGWEDGSHLLAGDGTVLGALGVRSTSRARVVVPVGVASLDDLGDELCHVHLDVKLDEVCEGVELEVDDIVGERHHGDQKHLFHVSGLEYETVRVQHVHPW